MHALDGAMVGRVLPILAAYGAAAVTPGANTVVVARTSLAAGRLKGVLTAFGVALGTALYASASLFGLSAVIHQVPTAARVLQLCGAMYLGWIGVRLITVRPELFGAREVAGEPARTFRRGLLTNLSNPHGIIFFVSIFSAMLSESIPTRERAVVLFAVSSMSVSWYSAVAVAFSSVRAQGLYQRGARFLDIVAGAVMVWFALRFALAAIG